MRNSHDECRLVKLATQKTRCRNLCLAGGVTLNSKANGKILVSGIVEKMFVQPAASDDGVAPRRSPLLLISMTTVNSPGKAMRHGYLGAGIFEDTAIEDTLRTFKLRYARKVSEPASTAAELLANHYRMVPRAHGIRPARGRRSFGPWRIPRDPEMNAKVNNAVKFREWWRPFAPSMLNEVAA